MSKICVNCKKEIPSNALYCSYCGAQQISEEDLSEEEKLRKELAEAEATIQAMKKVILDTSSNESQVQGQNNNMQSEMDYDYLENYLANGTDLFEKEKDVLRCDIQPCLSEKQTYECSEPVPVERKSVAEYQKTRYVPFMRSIGLFFSNYANFSGRSSRAEYWWPTIINALLMLIPGFGMIYAFIVLIPALAVGVRRLHDVNKSGWFILFGIIPILNLYLIILFLCSSSELVNEYEPTC